MRPRSGSGPTMEKGVNQDRIAAWRWVASTLIYPVMILPGLNATVLLISSVCVGLDSWSLEGALSNMSLGFPAVAGIAALWFSTHTPIPSTAQPLALLARHDGPDDGLAHGVPVLEGGHSEPGRTPAQVRLSRTLGLRRSPGGRLRQPHTADLGQKSDEQAGSSGTGPCRPASSSGSTAELAACATRAITAASAHAVVGTVRELRQPGGSRVIVRTKVSHSIPYFRSFCRSVARWMPIC